MFCACTRSNTKDIRAGVRNTPAGESPKGVTLNPGKGRCKGTMEAYCVKCKAKRQMKDAKAVTMKNGKPATQGVCPTCGTKMFKIGKA